MIAERKRTVEEDRSLGPTLSMEAKGVSLGVSLRGLLEMGVFRFIQHHFFPSNQQHHRQHYSPAPFLSTALSSALFISTILIISTIDSTIDSTTPLPSTAHSTAHSLISTPSPTPQHLLKGRAPEYSSRIGKTCRLILVCRIWDILLQLFHAEACVVIVIALGLLNAETDTNGLID